jgi:hypothetical protein
VVLLHVDPLIIGLAGLLQIICHIASNDVPEQQAMFLKNLGDCGCFPYIETRPHAEMSVHSRQLFTARKSYGHKGDSVQR